LILTEHKRSFRLTRAAEADYASLLRYSRKRWGKLQAEIYRLIIDDSIAAIAADPYRRNTYGRDEVRPGLRSFHVGLDGERAKQGRHILYFRLADDGIVEVVRILHDRMDMRRRLADK
jgi:toxin ParE1/3/4